MIGIYLFQATERQRRRGQLTEEFENKVLVAKVKNRDPVDSSEDRIEVLTVSDSLQQYYRFMNRVRYICQVKRK